ncbi:MAG TPA: UvrD-helicase domain-containing protein [Desulfotomaculum sp.]|nr:UvrD-helicase domain-containing protein [Desulfotomaculum sp.]
MGTWLVSRAELTPEQIRAIELDPREHRVIFGPPGSGKTLVLLYRARHLCDLWNVGPERFRIFVFTNVLKEYIRSALDYLNLPEDCVCTFDRWCLAFYCKHISEHLPRDEENDVPDFPGIRRAVLEEIQRNPASLPFYDFVMVDEGQDLDGISFELMRLIARHVTVCMDHKQQIYEGRGSSEEEILKKLKLRRCNLSLLQALRCCPYVARLAAQFVNDPEQKVSYLNQVKTYQGERETPLLYYAGDFEDEKRRLVEILRVRLSRGEKVAILFPLRRQVYGFARRFREAGLEVETMDDLDFASGLPKMITYHSAKGLTFDTVLLPRLVPASFPNKKEETIARLLFVGITRATKWVYLSTYRDRALTVLGRVDPLAAEGVITIQTGQASLPVSSEGLSAGKGPGDEDEPYILDELL